MPGRHFFLLRIPYRGIILFGSLVAVFPVAWAQRLPIRQFTPNDGLASSFVRTIVRDSRGFLWFCTNDGLSRFDGARFTTYRREHGLPHSSINHLIETRDGHYWVATNGGGVARFDPRLHRPGSPSSPILTLKVGETAATNHVNQLFEDPSGGIWATTDDGLYRLTETSEGQAFRPIVVRDSPAWEIAGRTDPLVMDQRGGIWMGWGDRGLLRLAADPGQTIVSATPMLPNKLISALLVDRQGQIWAGGRNGLSLFVYDRSIDRYSASPLPQSLEILKDQRIFSLFQTRNGRIWIGGFAGLFVYQDDQLTKYTTASGLIDNLVFSMAEDMEGNLWMATMSSGAMRMARNGFTTWDNRDEPGMASIFSIRELPTGELLSVNNNGQLVWFEGERIFSLRPNLPPTFDLFWLSPSVHIDRFGEWWIYGTIGLFRFPAVRGVADLARVKPKSVIDAHHGLPSNQVIAIEEDHRGDLLISNYRENKPLLTRWERATGKLHRVELPEFSPPLRSPACMIRDGAGNIWLGFLDRGIARYRDGQVHFLSPARGWPDEKVTGFLLDRRGRLWIGSHNGLVRVDDPGAENPRPIYYTTKEGLTSNTIGCLVDDQWGRIYTAAKGRGIDRLDPDTGQILHYTMSDGLGSDSVISAFRDSRNHLWFGAMKGLSRLIPEPNRAPNPPSVFIESLRLNSRPQPVSTIGETAIEGLEFDAGKSDLEISFSGLAFAVGEKLRFQYRLVGIDRDWRAPDENRSLHFANLAPGQYRFEVRAIDSYNLTSEVPAVVSFHIAPPIHRRWWFTAIVLAAAGMAAFMLYRYRVAHLLAMERMRMRIAADLHDDVGSNLSRIALLSEVARQRLNRDDPEIADRLSRMASISRESVDALGDIVWSINPARDRLSDLTQRMRRVADDFLAARGIAFAFDSTVTDLGTPIDSETRRELLLVFKECLHNIARHAACSAVTARFSRQGDRLLLLIHDDGQGIDPTSHDNNHGHGLESMRQRARRLGGEISIVSNNGDGTTVTLSVPLHRKRPPR